MIDKKELERYRAMSIEERLQEFTQLMDAAFELLAGLPPEERRRRWKVWEEAEEQSALQLARKLARLPR
jgi:hypothetical protein